MNIELEIKPDLVVSAMQGNVQGLLVRPVKREPVELVDAWVIGGTRDHGHTRVKRAVTLIATEDLTAMAQTIGREVDWSVARRNVLVSGVPLLALIGRQFRLGTAVLEGTRPCDPCRHMHRLYGPDGYTAMIGRGGLCARIVTPGEVHIGDTLELIAETTAGA